MTTNAKVMHPLSEQCPATSKRSRQRCQRQVIGGGPCAIHGGKAPQVAAKREARILVWEAQQRREPLVDRDPADALLAAAKTADQLVQRLQQEMRDQDRLQPATLTALGDWLDRTGRLSKTVLDAMVDERRIRISEVQGNQLAEVLRRTLTELGHDVTPGSEAALIVARNLRRMALTTVGEEDDHDEEDDEEDDHDDRPPVPIRAVEARRALTSGRTR